jgi:hypothetical protein
MHSPLWPKVKKRKANQGKTVPVVAGTPLYSCLLKTGKAKDAPGNISKAGKTLPGTGKI